MIVGTVALKGKISNCIINGVSSSMKSSKSCHKVDIFILDGGVNVARLNVAMLNLLISTGNLVLQLYNKTARKGRL